jgi:uncharacterized protein YjiS (DUF1127 family)
MAMNWASSRGDSLITAYVPRSLRTRLIDTVREWRRRARSRRELAGLSSLELKDIPNRAAAEAEKFKPFWKA